MIEKELVVNIKTGLHARPTAQLVKGLSQYSSTVILEVKEKKYNAKSIMGVMSAAIYEGTQVRVIIDGADEEETLEWISHFFSS